ncbi:MAG: biopolymer transporter ExbD [Verrucomicrobia bacterium]|nr:biopolymer transporter ExbD [Verrucomicrobiota bacterium]MCH8527540.1 biopolymer transporter ExbD [Kiritimatiellia bacterium]
MRIRTHRPQEEATVSLTPLIDCVFLLIVFFLVTSMFRRWEMIVPFNLPDPTSSLSERAEENVILLGMSRGGEFSLGERGLRDNEPVVLYQAIPDVYAFLRELAGTRGLETPIVIATDRDTTMERILRVIDEIKLIGFPHVSVHTRERSP